MIRQCILPSMKKIVPGLGVLIRGVLLGVGWWMGGIALAADAPPIDRHALVTRHNPVLTKLDPGSPLSVGNGEFCFTADVTGLQTFPDAYGGPNDIPLCTMADWGWHSFPNPQNFSMDTFAYKNYDSHGRLVGYADEIKNGPNSASSTYLRENPHKFNLAQIGFVLTKSDGAPAKPADLSDIKQTLDLWNGVLISHFVFDGQPVDVQTICAPKLDLVVTRVKSPLLGTGRIAVQVRFPYGSKGKNGSDWTKPDAHQTTLTPDAKAGSAILSRTLDGFSYDVVTAWSDLRQELQQTAPHMFRVSPGKDQEYFDFACYFIPPHTPRNLNDGDPLSDAAHFQAATKSYWNTFWSAGGAIDLSQSKDPRWNELERRIVLSEYLTAIQSTGKNPPAETGLTMNSWYGRPHMEMYWWHDAHFALWGRAPLMENSLGFYQLALPNALANAKRQGYDGARWPKMTQPNGLDSPSSVGAFLLWEQPHAIYMAELDYRAHPNRATLDQYKEVVFATADFMASFAFWDDATQRYILGPPTQGAQEQFDKTTTFNLTFELVYWHWGLETAQQWRERLGLPRNEKWDAVLKGLSKLPVADGKYLFAESATDTYTNPKYRTDHPSVTAAFGILPGAGVDHATMQNTFDWIWQNWDWPGTWGWDYPMLAMCAARLCDGERAIQSLLLDTPKNHWAANGHNFQRGGTSDTTLPLYLPSNGGLLTAVAMMAAGWDGAPQRNAPGFPDNGQWVVRWEGLLPLP